MPSKQTISHTPWHVLTKSADKPERLHPLPGPPSGMEPGELCTARISHTTMYCEDVAYNYCRASIFYVRQTFAVIHGVYTHCFACPVKCCQMLSATQGRKARESQRKCERAGKRSL